MFDNTSDNKSENVSFDENVDGAERRKEERKMEI